MVKQIVKTFANIPVTLTVSPPPLWRNKRTVDLILQRYLLALVPALLLAVAYFGIEALRVVALSGAVAIGTQALCEKIMHKDMTIDNYHALLMGVLFAFLLPASAPWWLVAVGSASSIALGSMLFGGMGSNPLCAPLIGWAICKISWPGAMDIDLSMLNTQMISPLSQFKYFGMEGIADISYMKLVLGCQLGGLGAAQVAAVLAGGIYLLSRNYLRPIIPISFLAGVFGSALVYWLIDPSQYADPLFHLLSGSVVFGAFFLATDWGSSPVGKIPMILFGLIAGTLVVVIRIYGVYPDGVPFAILLANLLTPLLDCIQPKPFGAGGKA